MEQYKEQLKESDVGEELAALKDSLEKINELVPEEAAPS